MWLTEALPMTASTAPFSTCQPRWVPSSPATQLLPGSCTPSPQHSPELQQVPAQRWGLFSHLASPEQDPHVHVPGRALQDAPSNGGAASSQPPGQQSPGEPPAAAARSRTGAPGVRGAGPGRAGPGGVPGSPPSPAVPWELQPGAAVGVPGCGVCSRQLPAGVFSAGRSDVYRSGRSAPAAEAVCVCARREGGAPLLLRARHARCCGPGAPEQGC